MTVEAKAADGLYGHIASGRSRKAILGVLWSIVSTTVPNLVSILVFLITSRALQPGDFGLVAFAAGIATVLGSLVPTGFGTALIQRTHVSRDHFDAVFWLGAGAGALLYGLLLLAAYPLSAYFAQPMLAILVPVLGLKIVFGMLGIVPTALLTRSMDFHKLSVRTTLASLFGAGACLVLLYAGYGLWALVASQLVSAFATVVGSFLAVRWLPRLSVRLSALRDLFHFGGFTSLTNFVTGLSLDDVLIGALLGAHALGQFNFGRRIFTLLNDAMAGPLNAVSLSLLSSLQSEQEKQRTVFLLATFVSALVSFPVFAGLAAVADILVPVVFGEQWVEAVPVLQAFCAIGLLTCIGVLQYSLISSFGRADLWLWYILAKQTVTVLYIVLFHRYGIADLAFALTVQTYVMWLPSVYLVSRLLGVSMLHYLATFLAPVAASIVMLAAVEMIQSHTMQLDAPWQLASCIAVGAAIYVAAACLFAPRRIHAIWNALSGRGDGL
ncbi:lipopolysaccharide biosynthesis protein [Devosia sp. Naph2]|uniref:lipopolysaccharide biosynthesis protein n=1 Tax=Devosia polycyclovorans TaxID=3345148 RepID=UPI0035D0E13A